METWGIVSSDIRTGEIIEPELSPVVYSALQSPDTDKFGLTLSMIKMLLKCQYFHLYIVKNHTIAPESKSMAVITCAFCGIQKDPDLIRFVKN